MVCRLLLILFIILSNGGVHGPNNVTSSLALPAEESLSGTRVSDVLMMWKRSRAQRPRDGRKGKPVRVRGVDNVAGGWQNALKGN